MNHISYGEILLDTSNRLVDFNLPAEKLPGLPGKIEILQSAPQALGSWWEQISTMISLDPTTKEVSQQTETGEMFFLVKSMPLVQPGGMRIGQVFMFEDVTHLREARKEHVQKVWMQASLEEREQLAGELHDRLSQSLAYLNLQVQAAHLHMQNGRNEAAQECLSRLIFDMEEIQQETRGLICNLLSVGSSVENFWEALQHLLEKFRQQTGMDADLAVEEKDADTNDKFAFDPTGIPAPAAMQLIRITQEALSNARRHAKGMSRVSVQLSACQGQLVLSIEDDGEGFDPSHPPSNGQHFGLKIMRQRAERVSGQMFVHSTPGKGTRIEVCLPLIGS